MGIDNDVGNDTVLSEWHVLLRPEHRQHTFLTVTGAELVADHRVPGVADRVTKVNVVGPTFLISHQPHILHASWLAVLEASILCLGSSLVIDAKLCTAMLQLLPYEGQTIIIEALFLEFNFRILSVSLRVHHSIS